MKHLYAGYIAVEKHRSGAITIVPHAELASSREEAIGKAIEAALIQFPPSEQWDNHAADFVEINDEFVRTPVSLTPKREWK